MLSKEEIKKWLLENCVDSIGDLNLSSLDFSDFDGDIYTSNMKVKKDLYQSHQAVGGSLTQDCQKVVGNIFQDEELKRPSLTTIDYKAETDRLTKENQELKEKLEGYETLLLHLAKELKEGKQNDK